jgi:hypothetical protein
VDGLALFPFFFSRESEAKLEGRSTECGGSWAGAINMHRAGCDEGHACLSVQSYIIYITAALVARLRRPE